MTITKTWLTVKRSTKNILFALSPSLLKIIQHFNKKIIYQFRCSRQLRKLPQQITDYYRSCDREEINEIVEHVTTYGIEMFPYEFIKKYKSEDIVVYCDDHIQYPYAYIGTKRVYFPKHLHETEIKNAVTSALMEQDEQSPHRYLAESLSLNQDDVAVLVGASDGIFCLSIIDRVRKVYLFEADEHWIAPLQYTFAPYEGKVEIVKRFVSSMDHKERITLDTYFDQIGSKVNYIQADIEGNEKDLLLGAKKILNGSNIKLSICCYHNQEDQKELSAILNQYGFELHYSKGYMLMWMQVPCKEPYFRKGVIYASKNVNLQHMQYATSSP